MDANLHIRRHRSYTDLSGRRVSPGKCNHAGYVDVYDRGESWLDWPDTPDVYQVGMDPHDEWCCSKWARPPPDALWWVPGEKGILITQVSTANLNFHNTPLELRHTLSAREDDPTLKILAQNERLLWKGVRKTFIPFKRPHPQGYQGVWMCPNLEVGGLGEGIQVHDKFNSDHVLEIDWGYDVRRKSQL